MENAVARRGQGSFPFSKGESENQKDLASGLGFAALRGPPSVISLSLRWWSSRKLAERSISGPATLEPPGNLSKVLMSGPAPGPFKQSP